MAAAVEMENGSGNLFSPVTEEEEDVDMSSIASKVQILVTYVIL